ncbi:MAG: two-component system, NarL family, invasion response regulator UvrY, partial [Mycobacterium sp.]|nr:two-component system, NarL family, invasion response regulator UvrY [Mycobacterium sp.]
MPHHPEMADERVRVWVVDDQASFRLATAATVAATEDFTMGGDCETGESAIELIPDG